MAGFSRKLPASMGLQQRVDLAAQLEVVAARAVQIGLTRVVVTHLCGFVEDRLHALWFGAHRPLSFRLRVIRAQDSATSGGRIVPRPRSFFLRGRIVLGGSTADRATRGHMPSGGWPCAPRCPAPRRPLRSVSPAKYRSFTTSATAGSSAARRSRASSSASRSSDGSSAARSIRSRSIRPSAAAMAEPALAAGVLDQDPPHGFGRRGEEVPASIPGTLGVAADQAEICLMHQGGRLESLPGRLVREPLRGQAAQLVIDHREQVARRLRVALPDRLDQARHVGAVVLMRHRPVPRST